MLDFDHSNFTQADFFAIESSPQDRAVIDQLIAETKLYSTSDALKQLINFSARFRHIAPFNAMLLHIQKPGLSFAARPKDWVERFNRTIKPYARPLVILRNFGPVEFVYDILDTEGEELPESAYTFPANGEIPVNYANSIEGKLLSAGIKVEWLDRGDHMAGHARKLTRHGDKTMYESFEIGLNRNHPASTLLVTTAHELAHIYLGHCGADEKRSVKFYRPDSEALREVEAETIAYLVAKRTGVSPRSEAYLNKYQGAFQHLNIHMILKVAAAVEKVMSLPFREAKKFGLSRGSIY